MRDKILFIRGDTMKVKITLCFILIILIAGLLYLKFNDLNATKSSNITENHTNTLLEQNDESNEILEMNQDKEDDTQEDNHDINDHAKPIEQKEQPNIAFISQTKIEYGSNITSDSFISELNGELIDLSTLDTLKLGKQNLLYCVRLDDQQKDFYHEVEVIDTQVPVISTDYNAIIFDYEEKLDFSLLNIQVYDKVDGSFTESKTLDRNTYVLEHQIDTKKAQEYLLVIKAMDGHDLVSEKNIQVIVKEKPKEETQQKQEMNQQNTSDAIAPTYMNGILLVNKTHPIPRDFGGNDNTAYNALLELQQGALAVGYNIPLLSGYRSYDYQKSLYEAYVARDGVEAADRYSAKPGTSEHQTGLAFDVGELSWDYGQTAPGQWLVENCAQYGFILRYLDGKEHITGYMYEPWHIRYVGVEHATKIMNQGLTLEEYLGVE